MIFSVRAVFYAPVAVRNYFPGVPNEVSALHFLDIPIGPTAIHATATSPGIRPAEWLVAGRRGIVRQCLKRPPTKQCDNVLHHMEIASIARRPADGHVT
jgi:hypothetical protein